VSPAKKGGRFSYLTSAAQGSETGFAEAQRKDSRTKTDGGGGGGGGGGGEEVRSSRQRRRSAGREGTGQELTSVPKGKGRMKQERSQLNVRIPTTLKRRASAKAVLEGRDIGEVVEGLLREYLER
jgi:hypothetical protein